MDKRFVLLSTNRLASKKVIVVKRKLLRILNNCKSQEKEDTTTGLPDGLFVNQNPSLGTFCRTFELNCGYILCPLSIF
jgi:hypothetical protein